MPFMHLKKGSREAKAYMAKLRAMRGKNKKTGGACPGAGAIGGRRRIAPPPSSSYKIPGRDWVYQRNNELPGWKMNYEKLAKLRKKLEETP